jgi:hypothetical protein
MATEFSNGKQTVKLYRSVNRGREMYQLAFYQAGRRVQKNFSDKAEAKRVAKQILGGLTNDAVAVEAMAAPELESLIAARRVLVGGYALHVAVEEHAQAVTKLGKATLREAVEFFLRHHRIDVPRLPLSEVSEQFAASRQPPPPTKEPGQTLSIEGNQYPLLARSFLTGKAEGFFSQRLIVGIVEEAKRGTVLHTHNRSLRK